MKELNKNWLYTILTEGREVKVNNSLYTEASIRMDISPRTGKEVFVFEGCEVFEEEKFEDLFTYLKDNGYNDFIY